MIKWERNMSNIIFDLDGTLWDSTQTVQKAWLNTFNKYKLLGKNIRIDFIQNCMGKTNDEIVKMISEKLTNSVNADIILKECQNEEIRLIKKEGGKLYANLKEVLKFLKLKNSLYIVSNCQQGYIEAFLNYYNLGDFFCDYQSPDDLLKNKTECLRGLIKRNCITNFYYIGDSEYDLFATKDNRGKFIYAEYGFGNLDYQPSIKKLNDILLLKDLN